MIYRDPFGEATAPGRWPTLTMHSDCFLASTGNVGLSGMRILMALDGVSRGATFWQLLKQAIGQTICAAGLLHEARRSPDLFLAPSEACEGGSESFITRYVLHVSHVKKGGSNDDPRLGLVDGAPRPIAWAAFLSGSRLRQRAGPRTRPNIATIPRPLPTYTL